MPTYDYACDCGHAVTDYFRHVNDPDPDCQCGKPMIQTFLTPRMVSSFFFGSTKNPGYKCPVTDRWVSTKRQRLSIMDEHNLVERPDPIPQKEYTPTVSCKDFIT
jgi:hypothetical protein